MHEPSYVCEKNMGKLGAFVFISLDGYYKDIHNDISWHRHEEGESEFSADNLKNDNILLFGRKTFELMESFWPTPMAAQQYPEVARGMNRAEKLVVSRTMKDATWQHTKVLGEDFIQTIRQLKLSSAKDITLLGSGEILTQLADAQLLDELQLMVDPVVLGQGTSIFHQLTSLMTLELKSTRIFKTGVVLLYYKPVYS